MAERFRMRVTRVGKGVLGLGRGVVIVTYE